MPRCLRLARCNTLLPNPDASPQASEGLPRCLCLVRNSFETIMKCPSLHPQQPFLASVLVGASHLRPHWRVWRPCASDMATHLRLDSTVLTRPSPAALR